MTSDLIVRASNQANLIRAWNHLQARSKAGTSRAHHLEHMAPDIAHTIRDLSHDLRQGTYCPAPFGLGSLPKKDGTSRQIVIPTVRDAIASSALLAQLDPLVDPALVPWSYAFRKGLGVADAVADVRSQVAWGSQVIVRTDIRSCFASIDPHEAVARLARLVGNNDVAGLVAALVIRGETGDVAGLPEGEPLSPLLMNLFVTTLDLGLLEAGIPAVRYADDLAIPLSPGARPDAAVATLRDLAAQLGLTLNDSKTSVHDLSSSPVTFLGETITIDDEPAPALRSAHARSIYITRQGATLRQRSRRMVVTHGDEVLHDQPWRNASRVVFLGRGGVTADAMRSASTHGIDVVMLTGHGRFVARVVGPVGHGAIARHRQHLVVADRDRRLTLAREVVRAKLTNLRVGLLRGARNGAYLACQTSIDTVERCLAGVDAAPDLAGLMGLEGAASQSYFAAYRRFFDPEWGFTVRARRPPPDPVNSMLSFGYTLLTAEAVAAVEAAGLDPAVGFLHSMKGNRPALALDLMEDLRPVIVDAVVRRLVARRAIAPTDFTTSADAGRTRVLLSDAGRRAFLAAYEERMLTVRYDPASERRLSYREVLHGRAESLAASLTAGSPVWRGIRWR